MVTKYLIAAPAVWKRSRKRIKSGNNVDRAKRPPENTAMKGAKCKRSLRFGAVGDADRRKPDKSTNIGKPATHEGSTPSACTMIFFIIWILACQSARIGRFYFETIKTVYI